MPVTSGTSDAGRTLCDDRTPAHRLNVCGVCVLLRRNASWNLKLYVCRPPRNAAHLLAVLKGVPRATCKTPAARCATGRVWDGKHHRFQKEEKRICHHFSCTFCSRIGAYIFSQPAVVLNSSASQPPVCMLYTCHLDIAYKSSSTMWHAPLSFSPLLAVNGRGVGFVRVLMPAGTPAADHCVVCRSDGC